MLRPTTSLVALAALIAPLVRADEYIYSDDSLSSTWQDWSWGTTTSYAATDLKQGTSSILATSAAWSALSFKDSANFKAAAGLRFDIAGAQPELQIIIESTAADATSVTIPLSAFGATITADKFTSLLLDFSALPPNGVNLGTGTWDRITFQALGNGATYHLDNVLLVDSIVVKPEFLSAEPIGTNVVAVTSKGIVDYSTIKVTLNSKSVVIKNTTTVPSVDIPNKSITYLTLGTPFAAGTLGITAGNSSYSYTLPTALSGTVSQGSTYPINPRVYGVNFPTSASYIQHLGVTISRRGGNAETTYNPYGSFTNAGNDWYFENRVTEVADDWVGWVKGAGSEAMLIIPSLDWVSKDASSYSYPKTIYPDQKAFDPYNADAGNGLFPNGSYVSPPDPSRVYMPWNATIAGKYLAGLKNKPTVVTVDNEMEIASSTHQDMHPAPMSYDEELGRVINISTVAKAAIPGVEVAAPSTCAWWFYWTSAVGADDKAAHNGSDFLPWFLTSMKAHDKKAGKRYLDILDVHYYYAPDTSANDAAAKALRLRMSRSLWDPTYVDESWIGTNTPFNSQPNATKVMLIPRMQKLIQDIYPGTKLAIGEFSSGADGDLTGGLLTADMLGIFGKYKLDSATYWATPDEKGPVGLAYWLYRGYGTYFGPNSALVSITGYNPNVLGVYAGTDSTRQKLTLVIINKDVKPVSLNLAGVPVGKYYIRHFGGNAGIAKYQTTITLDSYKYIVVPSYTAVFLQRL